MDEFYQKALVVVFGAVISIVVTIMGWFINRFIGKQDEQQKQINAIDKKQASIDDMKEDIKYVSGNISEVHTRIDDLGKTFDGKFDSMQKELISVIKGAK